MDKIEIVEDQDKLIIQNSIKYLDNLTQIKELNVPTLTSLYRTKCRLMELRRHIYLPQQKHYRRCQQCFMNFSEGNTKFEIRPAKLSSFAKKIIAKVNKNAILTTYQRTYFKKLSKKHPNGFQKQNKMVITCNYCEKETEIWMNKPKRKSLPSKNIITLTTKKKKAKKKDTFCGLNQTVVSLLSSKKKRKAIHLDKSNSNNNIEGLNTTNVFVAPKKININTSVSMTNTRDFHTSDFIPLESNSKQKQIIKFSRKKENVIEPFSKDVARSNERLKRKNLNSLSDILKRANDNQRNKPSSKLKNFLAGL